MVDSLTDESSSTPDENPPVRLQCDRLVRISSLSNFRKSSRVPDADDSFAVEFLTNAAADDFQNSLKDFHARLRKAFGYKRKAISVSEVHGAAASITTPDFHFHITLTIDSDDPRYANWNYCVSDIGDYETMFGDAFAMVFGELFNCVEFDSGVEFDVAAFIDRVEDLENDSMELDYGPDADFCVLSISGTDAEIHVDAESIRIVRDQPAVPAVLLKTYFELQSAMADAFDLPRIASS